MTNTAIPTVPSNAVVYFRSADASSVVVAQSVPSGGERITIWYIDSNTVNLEWTVQNREWSVVNATKFKPIIISTPVDMTGILDPPSANNIIRVSGMAALGRLFDTNQKIHVFMRDHSYARLTALAGAAADFHATTTGNNAGTWLDANWKNWPAARITTITGGVTRSVPASALFLPDKLVVGIITYMVKVTAQVAPPDSPLRLRLEVTGFHATGVRRGVAPTLRSNQGDAHVASHNTETADEELSRLLGNLNV
jgi:hypothetical protein